MAQLGNVCTNEETMHFLLGEGTSKDLEVFPGADLFMKLQIAGRNLPVAIQVLYENERSRNLTVSYSAEVK